VNFFRITFFAFFGGLIGMILALESCAPASRDPLPATDTNPVATSSDGGLAGQIHDEVNAYRRSKGKAELQRHPGLDKLARQHSEYLLRNRGKFGLYGKLVSHDGFEGRTLIARHQYNMSAVGENVAAGAFRGASAAAGLVAVWKGSKHHEVNMRDGWTYTGVGVARDKDGMLFATQLFASPQSPSVAPRGRTFHF
jgi:uncharacterized protein YkwD